MHMQLVTRGRANGVRDAGIRITPEEMNRKYGPPPYTHPSEVPPMQRMLIAMFAHGAREGIKGNLDMLHKFAAGGVLPDGSFEAWGIPLHPAYTYEKLRASRKNRSHARPNHHLTDPNDRIAWVRSWRDDFKSSGHCDAANVLTRFLMAYDQSEELLAGTADASELRSSIAAAAYQWVYAYGKSIGMTLDDLTVGYAPAKRSNISPETKQKARHVASRAGHYAARAGRATASVTARPARGVADLLDELAAPPAKHPKPRQNAHTVADKPLPASAQKALNDFAKAHGYNYVHAQIMSPRKIEAYLLQQEGDNFGMRVVATGSVLGRWEVKPYSPARARDNYSPEPSPKAVRALLGNTPDFDHFMRDAPKRPAPKGKTPKPPKKRK